MGLKYERQVRLDRSGRQSNCLESGILFLVVHYKELHQMNNWRAKKHATDTGVFFVSILKLSPTEWDWRYDEYDFGSDECRSHTAHGMMVKYPKSCGVASSYYISIPNVWKISESEPEQITFGGKTIHDTVMRVVNWQKQQEKVTQ